MRSFSVVLALLVSFLTTTAQVPKQEATYELLKKNAESEYAQKSYARAHAIYEELSKLKLDAAQQRWVTFRLADTAWRAEGNDQVSDPTNRDTARQQLEAVVRDSGEDHDQLWAEANESLGDFYALRQYPDIYAALPYYRAALDWWAGSSDLPLARKRYLGMLFRLSDRGDSNYYIADLDLLINAVKIADNDVDRAHAQTLLAAGYMSTSGSTRSVRALELLEAVIALGRKTEWYDDALFNAARSYEQAVVAGANGGITTDAQYAKALEYYRRLTTEFKPGESRFVPDALARINEITRPAVSLSVAGTFLPRSEQEVVVASRNLDGIDLTIAPVDLLDAAKHGAIDSPALRASGGEIRRWSIQPKAAAPYAPVTDRVRLIPTLPKGAWLVTARRGSVSSQQLVLVTDLNVTVHAAGRDLDVFVCDALSGAPAANADIVYTTSGDASRVRQDRTGADGHVTIHDSGGVNYRDIIVAARTGDRVAHTRTYVYGRSDGTPDEWRIYAFADRPAYRPGETVHWKFVARTRRGDTWTTPSGQSVQWQVMSPRGEKVAGAAATLNEFGSAWGDIELDSTMPLGSYYVQFTARDARGIGSAQLFRLEEYKLPEFRVTVQSGSPDGTPRLYRRGDTVAADIAAEYYFGGAVANANVEAVVYRRPFFHYWWGWREYPWYWPSTPGYWRGEEIKRETLKTDANGRAHIEIETTPDDPDNEYTIEARVTDASRREVTGSGVVRVTRQRYSVTAHPQHNIYRPGDKVVVDFKALDANDHPVQTTGTVTVMRRQWVEVWIDEQGHEVSGRALERARSADVFPPLPGWSLKVAKYEDERITETTVKTDSDGNASMTFDAPRSGYYAISWKSSDRNSGEPDRGVEDDVVTEATVFVTDGTVLNLGYNASGVQIIADRESFRSGSKATALLVTSTPDRWVFLTSAGNGILDSRVVHVEGTSKLIELDLDDRHTPSFCIVASSVLNRTLSTIAQMVVVPPVAHFLDVSVKTDRSEYEPRRDAEVTVTTKDVDGNPVSAEVALGVTDEAVTAIQKEIAGDPREFFFGALRHCAVQATASVQTQRYLSLTDVKGELVEERAVRRRDESQNAQGVAQGTVGGLQPPPPPAPAPQAMSEAITVTASAPAMLDAADVAKMPTARAVAKVDGAGNIDVQVRTDFSSTAFWKPDIVTGSDGTARVKVRFPDSLTTWRMTARAASRTTQVGMGSTTATTSMPLIVRLQSPRFFVERDRTVVSAVINNNTATPMLVTPSLHVEGLTLEGSGTASQLTVPPHGEARADWTVKSEHAGPAKLRVDAAATGHADAMEKTFTVYPHGVDKLLARSGKLRGDEAVIRLALPHARRATSLVVDVQPSLAVTMLDALPYLIQYPYGCTEQTMSRFLPAAIVARTLAGTGIDARSIEGRIFGGIDPRYASKTHSNSPRSFAQLDAVTAASIKRLYDFQHGDGSWGWWKNDDGDDWMTSYVVWGFSIANAGGLEIDEERVERAVQYLDRRLVEHEDDVNGRVWMLHALAAWKSLRSHSINQLERTAFDRAWTTRDQLSSYGRALLALAAHDFGDAARAMTLVRNLENGARLDRTPDKSVLLRGSGSGAAEVMATVHWGESGSWWRWFEGDVETTSFVLQALVTIDPGNKLIEPAMNWLVQNRRGAQWSNTRDTAIALLGLTDYLRASKELAADASYEVTVNGRSIGSRVITAKNVLDGAAHFDVDAAAISDDNEIRITRKSGSGALYFATYARFVSEEEPVKAAGNGLFVRRDYFRLAPRPTLLKGFVYDREPLHDLGSVTSGERIDVVVTIETKNDYEYLLFEDLKPAGLEAVELQSGSLVATEVRAGAAERRFAGGEPPAEHPSIVQRKASADRTWRSAWVYQELRDRNVALFVRNLPQGIWEIRYTLRAEVPGTFHALPLLGQAMYVPEIRANSDEVRVTVNEAQR